MKRLGLYVHVPFCAAKCAYCDFYSLAGSDALMDAYLDALAAQLDAFAPRALGYAVDTVYFGGGTPSYLGAARLCAILDAVRRRYNVAPGAEITLEANPDSVGGWFAELRAAGFNRVSLGAQSFDNALLKTIGRVHTAQQTAQAVGTIRRAGFRNLSLDLMYGLPGQSAASWRESVERALSLSPEHLSCYGLKLEPGTPLYSRRDLDFPDDDAQAELYLWTAARLSGHGPSGDGPSGDRQSGDGPSGDRQSGDGWRQYEISNFARPGYESRHNLKYWTLGEYLGFGPGAHSDFDGVRFAWARDLEAFIRRDWTPSECAAIAPGERARERVMLGLRTSDGVASATVDAGFARQCVAAGYAVTEDGRFRLTPRGFLVSNRIIGKMLEALE